MTPLVSTSSGLSHGWELDSSGQESTGKKDVRVVEENVQLMLLAQKLLGSAFGRRETGEVELEEDGLLPRRSFQVADGLRSLVRTTCSKIHLGVVL